MMRRFICLVLVVVAVLATAGDHGAGVSTLSAPPTPSLPVPTAGGMIVQIDPATGEPVEPTADSIRQLEDVMGRSLSRSSEGLVEVPSAVVGGGYLVDLQGRFQHTMTVTIDPSGALHSTCTSSAEAPHSASAGEVK